MTEEQTSADSTVCHAETATPDGDPRATIRAIEAAMAVQETTFDEHGLRFYVERREARIDVRFCILDRESAPLHPDMKPLWLVTALRRDDGLQLVEQENGSGEDAAQFFPSLMAHLDANPPLPMPDPTDARYLVVSGYDFRVRRFNRGFGEAVRVDLRVGWKDKAPASWMYAFDAELMPSLFGHSAALHVTDTAEMFVRPWGQIEHLVRFAAYASLVSNAPSAVIADQLPKLLLWGSDESLFTDVVAR